MVNVYEALTLGDRSLTGKVLADFTIDFCKTLEGVAVSQAGMTLAELGVGKYVLMNPNITERTIISGYLTSDSSKEFTVHMDPVDGNIAKDSTVAKAATTALEASVQSILAGSFGAGTGDTAVDHNTAPDGSTVADSMRVLSAGLPVDDATIKAYLKTDYDASRRGESYVQGRSATGADGRWVRPVYLDSGYTYTIVIYKQGSMSAATVEVTLP